MLKAIAKKILPNQIWRKLRSYKLKNAIKTFKTFNRKGSYGNHDLEIAIRDPLGAGWYNRDWSELSEIAFLKKYKLKEGAKVFDLGAHQGVVAMMLAKEVGSSGKVLAIEANKFNFNTALENKKLNDIEQLIIENCAIAERNGHVEFNENLNGAIENNQTDTMTTKVASFSINHLIDNFFTPDIIFMDIEGFEVQALKGARQAFETKCDWFIEVHGPDLIEQYGGTVQEVINHFTTKDYRLYIGSDDCEFKEYDASSSLLNNRFYLIAIS